ncbi:MAG TPA: hypothetical protein VK504_11775 [Vicinamibacterales bacterium]|nr:hypothetical protein [Vicinamibacterales bacterium]
MKRKLQSAPLRILFAVCAVGMLFVPDAAASASPERRAMDRDTAPSIQRVDTPLERIVKFIKKRVTSAPPSEDFPTPPRP